MNKNNKKITMKDFLKKILRKKSENYKRIETVYKFNNTLIEKLNSLKIGLDSIILIKDQEEKLNALENLRIEIINIRETILKFKLLIPNSFQILTSSDLRDYLYKILKDINFSKLNNFSKFTDYSRIELFQKKKELEEIIELDIEILTNFSNRLKELLKNDID